MVMRPFREDRCWSPEGARPHILIPLPAAVGALAEVYTGVLDRWREDWTRHLQPVQARFLHVTLTWLDTPSSGLAVGWADRLAGELAERLAGCRTFQLRFGPAIPSTYAVELYVGPDAPAADLARRCREAMHAVFGADAPVATPTQYRPHCAIAYSRTAESEDGLGRLLMSATAPGSAFRPEPAQVLVDTVIVTDQDTFAPGGLTWNETSVRTVPFPGAE